MFLLFALCFTLQPLLGGTEILDNHNRPNPGLGFGRHQLFPIAGVFPLTENFLGAQGRSGIIAKSLFFVRRDPN